MANGNGLKTASLVVAIVMAMVATAATTLSISAGQTNKRQEVQMEKIAVAVDTVKTCVVDLATIIAEQKMFSSSERALMDQRLKLVEKAVEEMKRP